MSLKQVAISSTHQLSLLIRSGNHATLWLACVPQSPAVSYGANGLCSSVPGKWICHGKAVGWVWIKSSSNFCWDTPKRFWQLDMKTQTGLTICGVLAIFDTAGTRKMLCTTLYTRTIDFKVVGLMHLTLTMATKSTIELWDDCQQETWPFRHIINSPWARVWIPRAIPTRRATCPRIGMDSFCAR